MSPTPRPTLTTFHLPLSIFHAPDLYLPQDPCTDCSHSQAHPSSRVSCHPGVSSIVSSQRGIFKDANGALPLPPPTAVSVPHGSCHLKPSRPVSCLSPHHQVRALSAAPQSCWLGTRTAPTTQKIPVALLDERTRACTAGVFSRAGKLLVAHRPDASSDLKYEFLGPSTLRFWFSR